MRQRVRVVAIVKNSEGEVLLLRRQRNEQFDTDVPPDFQREFELPNGKIEFGEQPEDALMRVVEDDMGIQIADFRFIDAASYVDARYGTDVANIYLIFELRPDKDPSDNIRISLKNQKYEEFRFVDFGAETNVRIEEWTKFVLEIAHVLNKNGSLSRAYALEASSSSIDVEVYVDGGSKGNPGPSAIGYVLFSPKSGEIERGGSFIGLKNSTEAEYEAIKTGVDRASQLGYRRVRINSDALTIVRQIQGASLVKDKRFWPIFADIEQITDKFDHFEIVYIPREKNTIADAEAGKILDSK